MTNGNDDSNQPSGRPNDWSQEPESNHSPDPQQPPGGPQVPPQQADQPSGGPQLPPQQADKPPATRPGSTPKLDNNDILAIVLSIFFPGVGQMMMGQTTKGIVILVVTVFTCAVGGLLSIAAALDAYCVAMAKKKRPIGEWEFFPDINDIF